MKGILGIFLVIALGIFMIIPLSASADKIIGIDLGVSLPDGVYCKINEVKLFALTEEDCEKPGGEVTHTVTTEVKENGKE